MDPQQPLPDAGDDAVTVTERNFRRAESDRYFERTVKLGGLGRLYHRRALVEIDRQTVIRSNRDTLYSSGVFDLDAAPVTVVLPDPGDRFMSMIVIDEDQYSRTFYAPGVFTLSRDAVQTRYAMVGLRTYVKPDDAQDLAAAHALQDAVRIEQARVGTLQVPRWDVASRDQVRNTLIERAARLPDTRRMFGARNEVDPERHLIGTATGWGGNAQKDAMYLTVVPARNDGKTVHRLVVPAHVPVDGFWSISVYGPDGFFHENPAGAYSVSDLTAHKNEDGSITVQFGGCDASTRNCLPIVDGWNYWVRLYRPRAQVLSGEFRFPEAQPV